MTNTKNATLVTTIVGGVRRTSQFARPRVTVRRMYVNAGWTVVSDRENYVILIRGTDTAELTTV